MRSHTHYADGARMLAQTQFLIKVRPLMAFGVGVSLEIVSHVRSLQRRCAFVVTDAGVSRSGLVDPIVRLLEAAGVATDVFDGVAPNPTDENVLAGAARLRLLSDAAVIAVGGGSVMDCGKAIGLLATNPGTVEELRARTDPVPGVPVIAIPTTAGTGSETNAACVITNTRLGRKTYVAHPHTVPKISLLDPALTLGLPRYPTATCGFDVLTHALEAYTSARPTPYSDAIALQAIRMVVQHLPRVLADGTDIEARSQMMLASSMAGMAFTVAGLGLAHGTGHALSARLNAAHGQTLATMLPHVMAYNLEARIDRYAELAVLLGTARAGASAVDNAHAAIAGVTALRNAIGLDRSIRALGGQDQLLPLLIADAAADSVNRSNARPVDEAAIEQLYRSAW